MPGKNNITRRQFLRETAVALGAGAAAAGVIGSFTSCPAEAANVPDNGTRKRT